MNNLTDIETRELLDHLCERFNHEEFIEHDPISIPRRFSSPEDIEIAGLFASTIAWGNRKAIVKSAGRMMEFMDNAPYDFVLNATGRDLYSLQGYVHRTFNGIDLMDFVVATRSICEEYGSLGKLVVELYNQSQSIPKVLSNFRSRFLQSEHHPHCEKHISSIDKGAACKRLNMYLRWMVRHDNNGVDFGLWREIPMSALYLPLDVHSGNVARTLGILTRKQSDWKAVSEATTTLRNFDCEDPIRYDFALFGAGIEGVLGDYLKGTSNNSPKYFSATIHPFRS
ncbi:MAG: TIGR02757 family protein [Rikenellaceae bacterium]